MTLLDKLTAKTLKNNIGMWSYQENALWHSEKKELTYTFIIWSNCVLTVPVCMWMLSFYG